MSLPTVTELARQFASAVLQEGRIAVDATVGDGRNTLFLAQQVGASGRVFGFDLQSHALEAARQQLVEAAVQERVELFQSGHETMKRLIPRVHHGSVHAVMFNLGYLPEAGKNVVTRPEATLQALAAATEILAPNGVLTAILYRGHPGGREECDQVEHWAARLSREQFDVYLYAPVNALRDAPRLLAISKRQPFVPVIPHERPLVA